MTCTTHDPLPEGIVLGHTGLRISAAINAVAAHPHPAWAVARRTKAHLFRGLGKLYAIEKFCRLVARVWKCLFED